MNPVNLFQKALVMGSYGVESVPSKAWRADLAAGKPVSYRAEISGSCQATLVDGTVVLIVAQATIFDGRTPMLFGAVDGYLYRESTGGLFTNVRELADGSVEFDGEEAGAVLKAQLAKGKTLRFENVELKPVMKDGVQVTSSGRLVFDVAHFENPSCVDRPAHVESTGGAAPIIAKGVAKAPQGKARVAQPSVAAAVAQVM
jgi:hypothetical protein